MGLVTLRPAYVWYFSYQIVLVQFGVIRCTRQNSYVKIFKSLLLPLLPLFSSSFNKIYGKYGNQGLPFGYLPNFNFFYGTTILGGEFQTATPPTGFIQFQPNFMRAFFTMWEYGLLFFGQVFFFLKVALKNFNIIMLVNGKILKCAML